MVASEFHCATLNTHCHVDIILSGNKPHVSLKFLLTKFNAELFCTYDRERTYYHRPHSYISAYTKYQLMEWSEIKQRVNIWKTKLLKQGLIPSGLQKRSQMTDHK